MTESGPCRRLCVSLVMLVSLSSSLFSSSSSLVKADVPCDSSGCCQVSNFAPGELNLSAPTGGFDAKLADEKAFIYHCLRYFTHFHWYRQRHSHDDNTTRLVPYPWGEEGRVSYIPGRPDNQTVMIPRVRKEDEGTYVFVASNGTAEMTGEFHLQVDCRDTSPSFSTREQPVQAVPLGSNKTLQCAVNVPDCPGKFYEANVFWIWRNLTSGRTRLLKNTTLDSVSVVCNRGTYFGGKCEVLVRHIEPEVFDGEFVCKLDDGSDLNQTVRLVPISPETDVKTWLPYVVGVAVGLPALMMLVAFVWWRYGHRVEFFCRSQPDRGDFEADAVLLHGEDHQEVVRETLLPGVRALGYGVLEDVTSPNRPEIADQLGAVEKSQSVILTFSAGELAEVNQINFLIRYVFNRKSPSTVVFIRCQDSDTTATNTPWKNEALRAFKILNLPRSLHPGNSQDQSMKETRNVEKFWCSLQKHLPKPACDKSPRIRSPGLMEARKDRSTNSSESHRPLMNSSSAERSSSGVGGFGTFSSERPTADVEVGNIEDETLPIHSVQPQTTRILAGDSNPQPSTTLPLDSSDDEVFKRPTTQPVLTPAEPADTTQGNSNNAARNQPSHPSTAGGSPENLPEPKPFLHSLSQRSDDALNRTEASQSSAETAYPSPTYPVGMTQPSPQSAARSDPRPIGGRPLGEGQRGDRRLRLGSGGKMESGGFGVQLESQESGYHSPSPYTEAAAFGTSLESEPTV